MKNLITFEGCDAVGKSTQVKLLKKYLNGNEKYVFSREPGGSYVAEKIRDIILKADNLSMSDKCEALLFAASRTQHLTDIIIPALNKGKTVFVDRYIDSSFAYQGIARGLGEEWILKLSDLAVGDYTPEYTIFLDLHPEEAFKRRAVDKNDRLEIEKLDFHNKVYEGYWKRIKSEPDRFIVIDAKGTAEDTSEKIINALKVRHIID